MTIPEVRDGLNEHAAWLDRHGFQVQAAKVRKYVEELYRRPYIRRAADRNPPLTPGVIQDINDYATLHPDASYEEIGAVFGVNIGRVSEALRGKRE